MAPKGCFISAEAVERVVGQIGETQEAARFRRVRSRHGAWRANYTPQLKKRTALLRKLKDVFRRYQSQSVDRVVQLIKPRCCAVG